MDGDRRLTQLRALIARLERLPESPRREWMLQEARARLVDVETGFEPRPMRSHAEEPELAPEAAASRTHDGRGVERPSPLPAPAAAPRRPLPPEASPEPAPPRTPMPSPEPSPPIFGDDTLLWLGDPSDDALAEPGDGPPDVAPWRRGLRG